MHMEQKRLLNILHVAIDGLFGSVPIILSFMVISFGAGEKEAGIIFSLANMVNTLIGLSAIFISGRLGVFHTLSLTILLYAAGYLTSSFSGHIVLAGFCFVMGNCGFSVFHTVAFSHLSSNTEKNALGRTLGDFAAMGDIGRIVWSSLAGFAAAFTIFGFPGWRTVCLLYGLVAALFAGYIFFFAAARKKSSGLRDRSHPDGKVKYLPDFSLLRRRQFALSMSASLLDAMGSTQVFAFIPFLLFSKGIDPKTIGAFAFVFTVGSFLGKKTGGRMVDMFGITRVFIISETVMAILLIILILAEQFYIIIGASLLLGIVTMGTVPVIQMLVTEPVKESREYNDIFAINNFSRGIANIFSPLLYGFIAAAAGISWSFGLMAVSVILALLPVMFLKRTGRLFPMNTQ